MSNKRRTAAWAAVGAVMGAVVMVASGAFAAHANTGTLALQPDTDLNVTCPNALSNTNVAANSETVNCAADTTTTTASSTTSTTVASTTTTQAPTTTTIPPTTTTVGQTTSTIAPPGGGQCTSAPSGVLGAFRYKGTPNSNGYNTYVGNNMWGATSSTTQTVCADPDPSNVTLSVNAGPGDYTGVQTYPDISQLMNDYCGTPAAAAWNCSTTTTRRSTSCTPCPGPTTSPTLRCRPATGRPPSTSGSPTRRTTK